MGNDENQHTPEPWTIKNGLLIVAGEKNICAIAKGLGQNDYEANARLIAAAPETAAERDKLKAANVELVKALNHGITLAAQAKTEDKGSACCQIIQHHLAVVAKAEGMANPNKRGSYSDAAIAKAEGKS
jgi:hypothetical protein